ncbi:Bet v I type allergen protein [Dioscorea alata]|uniref:Bet v I type allergen protein n=1 Tax=Dioscorea alata TaxID=55571 RepID=A0ACB7VPS5_DIOAL|nr:Bet v I type allergen protein [Dioscorea alata]
MSFSIEIDCSVSALRMFNLALHGLHLIGHEILPDVIKSASTIHVDGGVGSIRHIIFTSGFPFPYMKERLDFLDAVNFELRQSLVEGISLGTKLESASWCFKFIPINNGKSVFKMTTTYKLLTGVQLSDEEEKVKEMITGIIKACDAYLLANPNVCV